jgi:hypothetical protein
MTRGVQDARKKTAGAGMREEEPPAAKKFKRSAEEGRRPPERAALICATRTINEAQAFRGPRGAFAAARIRAIKAATERREMLKGAPAYSCLPMRRPRRAQRRTVESETLNISAAPQAEIRSSSSAELSGTRQQHAMTALIAL